jgi:hypothetical protein
MTKTLLVLTSSHQMLSTLLSVARYAFASCTFHLQYLLAIIVWTTAIADTEGVPCIFLA